MIIPYGSLSRSGNGKDNQTEEEYAMKKLILVLVLGLVLALLTAAVALADPLPGDIQGYFSSDTNIVANGKANADTWFVLTQKGNTSTLYCFRYRNNAWKHSFHAVKSVPQGKNGVEMDILSEFQDPASGVHHNGPILMLAKYDAGHEYYEQAVFYQLSKSGQWNLVTIIDRKSNADTIEVGEDSVTYYTYDGTNQKKTKVQGTIQRDIRYLSLESFPMNASAAKNKLTFAPDMPVNSELQPQDVQFTGGKKYEVYSGPGKDTIRSANGKAAVSTNGWIQVFGQENGWILIQYSIDKDHYRFGYIDAGSLPKDAYVGYLDFYARGAVITNTVSVTDDPLYSKNALTTANAGENVTWLATMGNWAYIEGANYRGFVPMSAIELPSAAGGADTAFQTYTAANGETYSMFEIRKLHYDAARHVYAVTGVYERTVEGDDCYYGEIADGGKTFTYSLAEDFKASMVTDGYGMENYAEVTDLYAWYVSAYLEGVEPEGEMVFQYDLPADQQADTPVDFWFVTTQIRLNQNNEIEYMEYVYVPWG